MQQVTVTIDPDGATSVEVEGVVGSSCEDLTRELEAALGTVSERTHKAEYHQTEVSHGQAARR